MPVGAIAMWSSLNGAVPGGWAECDGTANAPGPDLRDRFIVGRGAKALDSAGGAATHTHAAHTTVVGHTHQVRRERSATTGGATTQIARTADTSSTVDEGVFTESTGSASVAHDAPTSEPPWYALLYIQRMT